MKETDLLALLMVSFGWLVLILVLPLQAAEHFYLVTEPLERFTAMRPTLRVPDEEAYYKFDAGKLLLGAFERRARPWARWRRR